MDALQDQIQYLQAKSHQIRLSTWESGEYKLYENQNALPLGFLAEPTIESIEQPQMTT